MVVKGRSTYYAHGKKTTHTSAGMMSRKGNMRKKSSTKKFSY